MAKTAFVIRLGAIGDIMLITPILAALKRDGIKVTLACKPHAQWLLKGTGLVDRWFLWTPELDAKVNADTPEYLKANVVVDYLIEEGKGHDYLINLVGVIEGQCMRKVWDFSPEFLAERKDRDDLIKRFGIGQRADWRPTDENHVDALFKAAGQDPDKYTPEQKRPIWRVLPDERKWAKKKLKHYNVTDKDYLIVCQLAGSRFSEVWPWTEQFCLGVKGMIPEARVLLLGYGMDELACIEWAHKYPWVIPFAVGRCPAKRNAAGALDYAKSPISYRQDGALCEAADLYVGPNTSFLHVAAAVGTPTVPLYTACNHEQIGKYYPDTFPVHSPLDCSPCGLILTTCEHGPAGFAACMESISVARVLEAVKEAKEKTWHVGLRKTA